MRRREHITLKIVAHAGVSSTMRVKDHPSSSYAVIIRERGHLLAGWRLPARVPGSPTGTRGRQPVFLSSLVRDDDVLRLNLRVVLDSHRARNACVRDDLERDVARAGACTALANPVVLHALQVGVEGHEHASRLLDQMHRATASSRFGRTGAASPSNSETSRPSVFASTRISSNSLMMCWLCRILGFSHELGESADVRNEEEKLRPCPLVRRHDAPPATPWGQCRFSEYAPRNVKPFDGQP